MVDGQLIQLHLVDDTVDVNGAMICYVVVEHVLADNIVAVVVVDLSD